MNALDRKLVEMGLMEAEPGWFEVFILRLRAFVADNGHCKVTKEHVCLDGYKLGQRVGGIRQGNNNVTEEQWAELEALGFIWDAHAWYPEFIKNLKMFKAEHGSCAVRRDHVCPDGYKLGQTVGSIRAGGNKLTQEQRAELDALDFVWDASNTGTWWPEFLQHLRAFGGENGHYRVPLKHVCSKGYKLGQKTNRIRSGNNRITEEQRAELDALGFIWNASLYGTWYPEFIQHLRAFVAEHGHCRVLLKHVCLDGYRLGGAASHARSGHTKLTPEQRAELDALGFIWNASLYGTWYPEFLAHLVAFRAEHGHSLVPTAHMCPDGYKLGQRTTGIRCGHNKPTEEQRAELDALGFIWKAQHLRAQSEGLKARGSPVVGP